MFPPNKLRKKFLSFMLGATVVKHNQNAEQDNKSFTRFVLCMYVNCVDATLSVT